MKRKEQIISLIGHNLIRSAEWLEENDPELLDWIVSSKYWGRGFDEKPDRSAAVVELYFWDSGVGYTATFKSHPEGIRQSLNNQPTWGLDDWEDWEDEQLELYCNELRKEAVK